MGKEFPEYRDLMKPDRERQYVERLYGLYEKEGFHSEFWSCGGDYEEHIG